MRSTNRNIMRKERLEELGKVEIYHSSKESSAYVLGKTYRLDVQHSNICVKATKYLKI